MRYPVNNIAITKGYHTGKSLDFGWWEGHHQDILACADGVVYSIEKQPKGGNVIYLQHDKGILSAYVHLQTICVKKGQKVSMGQKIATMGKTGKATGEHLHFGLYSKGKNRWGNANLDPFNYCLIYPNQKINHNDNYEKYKNKIKYYDDGDVWKPGNYILLYEKALRKTHELGKNIYKVKECSKLTQKYLTSNRPNNDAYLRIGTEIKVSEIYNQGRRVWGRMGNSWLVLCNIDGRKQAKKV